MDCHEIDSRLEAFADGTLAPGQAASAHLESCPNCSAGLARARAIHDLLVSRELPVPSTSFTAGVMARVGRERWQAERVIDIGFNLAVAAGILFILIGGAGLAWSLGLLTITVDLNAVVQGSASDLASRVVSQAQTVAMAAVLLTGALGLWWLAGLESSRQS
jgi:anti-sigma factor RsiW